MSNALKQTREENDKMSSKDKKSTEKKNDKTKKSKKPKKLWQKILRVVLIILGVILLLVGGFFGWLTINEYRPKAVENVKVDTSEGEGKKLKKGDSIKVFTWNFGFGQASRVRCHHLIQMSFLYRK